MVALYSCSVSTFGPKRTNGIFSEAVHLIHLPAFASKLFTLYQATCLIAMDLRCIILHIDMHFHYWFSTTDFKNP